VCGSCTDGTMGHELLSADSIGPVEPTAYVRDASRRRACVRGPGPTYERVSDQSGQIGPVRKSPAKDKPLPPANLASHIMHNFTGKKSKQQNQVTILYSSLSNFEVNRNSNTNSWEV
jgi:hypothetical protein